MRRWLAASLFLAACGSTAPPQVSAGGDAGIPLVACSVKPPTTCSDPYPVYVTDIEPIIKSRCLPCHHGAVGGPWPLTDFRHVADWQDIIRAAMLKCEMPPADAGGPLPVEQAETILAWIRCGIPER